MRLRIPKWAASSGSFYTTTIYTGSASAYPRRRSFSSIISMHNPSYPPHHQHTHSHHHQRRRWSPFSLPHLLASTPTPTLLKYLILCTVFFVFTVWWLWELHVEIAFYPRDWIRNQVMAVPKPSGCFSRDRILATKYNLTQALAPKRTEVQAGLPLRLGMDCYDFAGTIQPLPRNQGSELPSSERMIYHTYWRNDLAPFTQRQEWMLKSFFATQNLATSKLILWSNGDLSTNQVLLHWLHRFPHAFEFRVIDMAELARGTSMEGSPYLHQTDKKAWVDGDLARLLVVWAHGGVWVDMDMLLTRDLEPLLEHEFVTQWDCYDKIYRPFNGAIMHFFQHSPYLCEAFHIMSTGAPPTSDSTEWGSQLYFKIWRSVITAKIPPFKVLPFCFTDGRACRLDNRLPDPFVDDDKAGKFGPWSRVFRGTKLAPEVAGMEEGGTLDATLQKVFSLHLHNQWAKTFPKGGWVERLLLKRYDDALGGARS